MTFKAGDKVECIDNSDYQSLLDLGRIYEVVESSGAFTTIKIDRLTSYSFHHFRFKLVEEKPMKFKAGDRVVCVNNSGVSSVVKVGDCGTVDTVGESLGLLVRMDDGSLRFFESYRFEILSREKFKIGSRVRCVNNSGIESLVSIGDCGTVTNDDTYGPTVEMDNGDFKVLQLHHSRVELVNEDKSYLGCINVYADEQILSGGTFKLTSRYDKDDVVITVDNNKSIIRIPEHRVRLLIKHLEEWLKNRRFDF